MRAKSRFSLSPRGRAVVVALAFFLGPLPAAADWLVTQDGERIETRGAWKVEGKRVVFRTKAGQLSSIRLNALDLEASRKATTEATRARRTPTAPVVEKKKAPVLVLREQDLPVVAVQALTAATSAAAADGQGTAQEGASGEPAQGAAPKDVSQSLRVIEWEDSYNPQENQLQITGTLLNGGREPIQSIRLMLLAYDESGALLGRYSASVARASLAPSATSDFRAILPVPKIAAVKFEFQGMPAKESSPEEAFTVPPTESEEEIPIP